MCIHDNGYSNIMNLTIYSSSDDAIKNYSGSNNTTAMISAYGIGTKKAAYYCRSFTFPNNKKGYLGSAGEWQAVYDNKSAIDTCMSKAGGTAFDNYGYYWSSTRADDLADDTGTYNRFWIFSVVNGKWINDKINSSSDYYDQYARAFTEL